MESASEEQLRQMSPWIAMDPENIDSSDKSCGCLPPPPNFDLPPPPMPPPSFGELGSVSEGVDWAAALTSDPALETCQKDIDRWTNSVGDDVLIPRWPGTDGEENGEKGPGDDFIDLTPTTPRFFGLFDQPLTVFVIIAAAASVVLLSICLLAFYCRK